jgi:hypothetical protein
LFYMPCTSHPPWLHHNNNFFLLFSWDETESTWYCGNYFACCTSPRWWWWLCSNQWNASWQGKRKYSEKTCPSATLSTTDSTWPDLGPNTGRRGGKLATNRLSYGLAVILTLINV